MPSSGSSPLTRGKQSSRKPPEIVIGLIPAHAGKTIPCISWCTICSAHPRSRGENADAVDFPDMAAGSSPLTRGKHCLFLSLSGGHRLIPAHAGKTGCGHDGHQRMRAHPRSRGENGGRVAGLRGVRGSSPLTRGKLADAMDQTRGEGLIPAHAGKTPDQRCKAVGRPAHPRSRGENGGRVAGLRGVRGSSPLTRGKLNRNVGMRGRVGLIPAHAGKTPTRHPQSSGCSAHPRSRGENMLGCTTPTRLERLIPAHAGKTGFTAATRALPEAHPRSRGENFAA